MGKRDPAATRAMQIVRDIRALQLDLPHQYPAILALCAELGEAKLRVYDLVRVQAACRCYHQWESL